MTPSRQWLSYPEVVISEGRPGWQEAFVGTVPGGRGDGEFGAFFTSSCLLLVSSNILYSSSHHPNEDHPRPPLSQKRGTLRNGVSKGLALRRPARVSLFPVVVLVTYT